VQKSSLKKTVARLYLICSLEKNTEIKKSLRGLILEQKICTIEIMTNGIGLYEITDNIATTVGELKFNNALINLSIPHTSCSLLIQENASPAVQNDLISFYKKIAPMDKNLYEHDIEGIDDMPAHIKTSLTQTNLTLSLIDKKLMLGKWQGIFLFEHRIANQMRKVVTHIMGDNS
jgi:secondary thiamine-phosphate synthase enzyme